MEQLNASNVLVGFGVLLLTAGAIQLLHEAAVLKRPSKDRVSVTLNLKNLSIRSAYPGVVMTIVGLLLLGPRL